MVMVTSDGKTKCSNLHASRAELAANLSRSFVASLIVKFEIAALSKMFPSSWGVSSASDFGQKEDWQVLRCRALPLPSWDEHERHSQTRVLSSTLRNKRKQDCVLSLSLQQDRFALESLVQMTADDRWTLVSATVAVAWKRKLRHWDR